MRELILKKCLKCGTMVKMLAKKEDQLICCGEAMQDVIPNSVDASAEKHLPEYQVNDGVTYVRVNHVMEMDHYIEWICLVNDEVEEYHYFKPGDVPEVTFASDKGILYAYCNKHSLWKIEIK